MTTRISLAELIATEHDTEPVRAAKYDRLNAEMAEAMDGKSEEDAERIYSKYRTMQELIGHLNHFERHRQDGTMDATCITASIVEQAMFALSQQSAVLHAVDQAMTGMDPEEISRAIGQLFEQSAEDNTNGK